MLPLTHTGLVSFAYLFHFKSDKLQRVGYHYSRNFWVIEVSGFITSTCRVFKFTSVFFTNQLIWEYLHLDTMLSLKIPDLNLQKNTSELVCFYFRFMYRNKSAKILKKQNEKKTNFECQICIKHESSNQGQYFYPGALISKAPIVFNIFILFNLFYSGQFFCLETGLPPMTMWSFEPRIGLALC